MTAPLLRTQDPTGVGGRARARPRGGQRGGLAAPTPGAQSAGALMGIVGLAWAERPDHSGAGRRDSGSGTTGTACGSPMPLGPRK